MRCWKLGSSLLAALVALAGCGRRTGLECWFTDSLVKVFPDDRPGAQPRTPASFEAARRSNLSLQFVLRSDQTLGNLFVEALPLSGPGLPIDTVAVRWVEYVVITSNTPDTPDDELLRKAPALFPDALLEEFPITLEAAKSRSIWLTVRVPADQAPGAYQGVVVVRQGREQLARLSYTVGVHRATAPDHIPLAVTNHFNLNDAHIRQFFGCPRYSEEWWGFIGNLARFLASYHQNSIVADPVGFVTARAHSGQIEYDFANWERFVETFERAGVDRYIEAGNLLWRERRRDAEILARCWVLEACQPVLRNLPYRDPRAQRFLTAFLPALGRVIERHGWKDKYLQGVLDEPREWEREAFVETANLVRRLLPGVRTIEPVGARQDLGFLARTTDIWVPCLGSFDDKLAVLNAHARDGGGLWYYTCLAPRGRYPNRFIDYSLAKVRILHWINFRYGLRGFLHWGGNYWGPEPFKDTQPVINEGRTYLPPGDAYITYPNRLRRSLYSSIRLEQMREGIEDFGLLEELRKKDPARAEQIAAEAVRSFTDYVRDPQRFREIHRKLLEAL